MVFPMYFQCPTCKQIAVRPAAIESARSDMVDPPEPKVDSTCHECTARSLKEGAGRYPRKVYMDEIDEDEFVALGGTPVADDDPSLWPMGADEMDALNRALRSEADPRAREEILDAMEDTAKHYNLKFNRKLH